MLVPATFDPESLSPFTVVKLVTVSLLALGALGSYLAWALERPAGLPPLRLGRNAALFLAAVAVATALSASPRLSLLGLYGRYGGLVPLLVYAAVALAVVGLHWERPHSLTLLITATVIGASLVATSVLFQQAGGRWFPHLRIRGFPLEFPGGTMGNSNFAGAYLGTTLAVVGVIWSEASRRWGGFGRLTVAAWTALCLAALVATSSRAGMVAAAVGFAALVRLERERLPRAATVMVTVIVLLLAGTFLTATAQPDWVPDRLAGLRALRPGSLEDRGRWWAAAGRIFLRQPVVGTGPDTFFAEYPPVRSSVDGARLGLTIPDKPHNLYLEYASGTGALGLAGFLLLVGTTLRSGARALRRVDGTNRALLSAFLAVLAGYLGQAFFSFDIPALAVVAWVAIGGVAAIADPGAISAQQSLAPPPAKLARRRWPLHAAITVAVVALSVAPVRLHLADREAHAARESSLGLPTTGAEVDGHIARAIRLNPWEPEYRRLAGQRAEALADEAPVGPQRHVQLRVALARYGDGCRLLPRNVACLVDMARVLTKLGRAGERTSFADSDRRWREAIALDPTDWELHDQSARMLVSWARAEGGDTGLRLRAAASFRRVVEMRPDLVAGWTELAKLALELGDTAEAVAAAERALRLHPTDADALAVLRSVR